MRYRDEKKWKAGPKGEIDQKKMDEDMGIIFRAIDENYKMVMQYKYSWTALRNFVQFRDERIWKNITYFIDWMGKNFEIGKFFEVLGKSYDLEDRILYRMIKTEDNNDGEPKTFETWLMSNVFRHVENPKKERNPQEKYIGKVKFTKIIQGPFDGDTDQIWKPPKINENGDDIEARADVHDIEIIVYKDDDMKEMRKYEEEHGWNEKWVTEGIYQIENNDVPAMKEEDNERYNMYKDFQAFVKKWAYLQKKKKVPGWYHFDPKCPNNCSPEHNRLKAWDASMFDFLKEQKWNERMTEKDAQGRNQYEEKSWFVVDCTQLLGIGGEGVVIRKAVSEKVGSTHDDQKDKEYEALKIIPITELKQNFEDEEKVKEMELADPERHFAGLALDGKGNSDQR